MSRAGVHNAACLAIVVQNPGENPSGTRKKDFKLTTLQQAGNKSLDYTPTTPTSPLYRLGSTARELLSINSVDEAAAGSVVETESGGFNPLFRLHDSFDANQIREIVKTEFVVVQALPIKSAY